MDRRREKALAHRKGVGAPEGNRNGSADHVEAARRAAKRYVRGIPKYITRLEYVEKQLLTRNYLSPEQIRRYEIVANIQLKKLDKVFPDLHSLVGDRERTLTDSDKRSLIEEAKALGLAVDRLFDDYGGAEDGEIIEGDADAVPDHEQGEAP